MKIPPPCQGCLWWGVWQQPDFLLVLPLHKSPAWISALTESWGLPSSQKRPFFSCWQGRASAQYRSLWESLSFFWQLANDTYALVPVPISSLWLWLASCNLLTCCLKWPFSWMVCSSSSLGFFHKMLLFFWSGKTHPSASGWREQQADPLLCLSLPERLLALEASSYQVAFLVTPKAFANLPMLLWGWAGTSTGWAAPQAPGLCRARCSPVLAGRTSSFSLCQYWAKLRAALASAPSHCWAERPMMRLVPRGHSHGVLIRSTRTWPGVLIRSRVVIWGDRLFGAAFSPSRSIVF